MEKKPIGLAKTGTAEPPANLFEQEEAMIAGNDITIQFEYKGKTFHQAKFKMGQNFEWVKHKAAEFLEVDYDDIMLYYMGKMVLEPFSIVDLNLKDKDTLKVEPTNPEATVAIENKLKK